MCVKYSTDQVKNWQAAEAACAKDPGSHAMACMTKEQSKFVRNTAEWRSWTMYITGISKQ